MRYPQLILRLAQIWIPILVIGSLQPARPAPVVGLHRELHWIAFAGATFLLLLLSPNRRWEIRSVIAACLLGLSLETLQHVIYRHAMEWRDVREDAASAVIALALYRLGSIGKTAFAAARTAPGLK